MFRISKDMELEEAAKEFAIFILEGMKEESNVYISGEYKIEDLADVIVWLNDLESFYDVDDALMFIDHNLPTIKKIYEEAVNKGDASMHSFKSVDSCMNRTFHYCIKEFLGKSDYLRQHEDDLILLTEDLIDLILDELCNGNEKEQDLER